MAMDGELLKWQKQKEKDLPVGTGKPGEITLENKD